jgi:hypothetical protein
MAQHSMGKRWAMGPTYAIYSTMPYPVFSDFRADMTDLKS